MLIGKQQKGLREEDNFETSCQKIKRNILHTTSLRKILFRHINYKYDKYDENDENEELEENEIRIAEYEEPFRLEIFGSVVTKVIRIKQWKKIRSLKVQTDLHPEIESFLPMITQSFNQLESLNFKERILLNEEDMNTLGTQIGRRLNRLRRLSLGVEGKQGASDKFLDLLIDQICKNFPNLTDLCFNLENFYAHARNINDRALKILSGIGRYLVRLRRFCIKLNNQLDISSEAIERFLSFTTRRTNHLESLSFSLDDSRSKWNRRTYLKENKVCQVHLLNIIDIITKNSSKLKYLQFILNYEWEDIPEKLLWTILSRINHNLTQLEYLSFNFHPHKSKIDMAPEPGLIIQLPTLKKLKLDFQKYPNSEKNIVYIISQISQCFPNLESFRIQISILDTISPGIIKSLIYDTSKGLPKLRELGVSFHFCKFFHFSEFENFEDSEDLEEFGWRENWRVKELEKIPVNLKRIFITFEDCDDYIDDGCFEQLGVQIVSFFPNLQGLTFQLSERTYHNSSGLERFATKINEGLVALKSIKLECEVSDDTCDSLLKMFDSLPNVCIINYEKYYGWETY